MVRRTKEQIKADNEKIAFVEKKLEGASELEIRIVFIPLIMRRQTEDEVRTKSTNNKNSRGLSAAHAPVITLYWDLIQNGYKLFPCQVERAKDVLGHYTKQFAEVAKEATSQ